MFHFDSNLNWTHQLSWLFLIRASLIACTLSIFSFYSKIKPSKSIRREQVSSAKQKNIDKTANWICMTSYKYIVKLKFLIKYSPQGVSVCVCVWGENFRNDFLRIRVHLYWDISFFHMVPPKHYTKMCTNKKKNKKNRNPLCLNEKW